VLKDSLNYTNGELFGEQFRYDSTGSLYKKETIFGRNIPAVVEMIKN
jgi:antitoxin component YwqK of YwqJK toxin-antitoxin module